MSDIKDIGVFVCECGGKIDGPLDVPALVHHTAGLPGVAWTGQARYWCLPAERDRIRSIAAEQHLSRIVIVGCSPRTHQQLFRRSLDDSMLVSMVNARDLCARPHHGAPAMENANAQIAMAVQDIAARQPAPARVAAVVAHAVVIGGGIAGITAALAVSDAGIPVTLVEQSDDLGGQARDLAGSRIATLRARENIHVLTGTTVDAIQGSVGSYQISLSSGESIQAGAVIVTTGAARPDGEPDITTSTAGRYNAFVLCDMSPERAQECKRTCCLNAIEQACQIKHVSPASSVTILFRELYTAGGEYDEHCWEANQLGVQFVRYPAGKAPALADGELRTFDELTGKAVRIPCDRIVEPQGMRARPETRRLAEMLRLPIDRSGFLADSRLRLRPADRIERGIYVCGAAHYPCDANRAMFQAYSAAARAVRHIQSSQVSNSAPTVTIDPTRCNGCGDCARVCPFQAITLAPRSDVVRLANVESMLCTGCGNCVSVCPVNAARVAGTYKDSIESLMRVALDSEHDNRVLLFACEWSGYAAAEMAGVQGLEYSSNTRLIRINCTGRLEPGILLKGLELGAAGVMVLGCAPGSCHYEQGNEHAATVFGQANALADLLAMDGRLACKWIPPDDGPQFVQVVDGFVAACTTLARERA